MFLFKKNRDEKKTVLACSEPEGSEYDGVIGVAIWSHGRIREFPHRPFFDGKNPGDSKPDLCIPSAQNVQDCFSKAFFFNTIRKFNSFPPDFFCIIYMPKRKPDHLPAITF